MVYGECQIGDPLARHRWNGDNGPYRHTSAVARPIDLFIMDSHSRNRSFHQPRRITRGLALRLYVERGPGATPAVRVGLTDIHHGYASCAVSQARSGRAFHLRQCRGVSAFHAAALWWIHHATTSSGFNFSELNGIPCARVASSRFMMHPPESGAGDIAHRQA